MNIIGKSIAILMLGSIFFGSCDCWAMPQLHMRMTTLDGEPLKQAAVLEPFLLELEIIGGSSTSPEVFLHGVEKFNAARTGVYVTMVQGKTTVKYMYRLIIDSKGLHTVGPAELTENGKKIVSEKVTVRVGQQELLEQGSARQQEKKKSQPQLRITADKSNVVVGEPIGLGIRFYVNSDTIALQSLQVPELKDFITTDTEGPVQGSAKLDGKLWNYVEWHWKVIPQTPGKKMLPLFSVEFLQEREDNFFSGFSLFRKSAERKRVYSNSLSVSVESLPPVSGKVIGVGKFSALKMSVDQSVIKEGDALVLTIELLGQSSFQGVGDIELPYIPKGLKSYSSKVYTVDSQQKGGLSKKCFEFIVQGIEPGDWKIPAQEVLFFDTDQRVYKKLHSNTILVSVLPYALARKNALTPSQLDKQLDKQLGNEIDITKKIETVASEKNGTIKQPLDGLAPLIQTYAPITHAAYCLPGWIFWLLFLVPLIVLLITLINALRARYNTEKSVLKKSKKAFLLARKQLAVCEKHGSTNTLYQVIIQLFANRLMIKITMITEDYIQEFLRDKGLSEQQLRDWHEFFSLLAESAFVKHNSDVRSDTPLLQKTYYWIDVLEKLM